MAYSLAWDWALEENTSTNIAHKRVKTVLHRRPEWKNIKAGKCKCESCTLKSSKLHFTRRAITFLRQEKNNVATGDETNLHSGCRIKKLHFQLSAEMHDLNKPKKRISLRSPTSSQREIRLYQHFSDKHESTVAKKALRCSCLILFTVFVLITNTASEAKTVNLKAHWFSAN